MTTLHTYEEMIADLAEHTKTTISWKKSESVMHLLHQTRYLKLFSDVYDKPQSLDKLQNLFNDYCVENMIPRMDKEPEAGFNLYYSSTPRCKDQASDMTALFEYFGTYTDHEDVPLEKLPVEAVQFMIIGEDYSFMRMQKEMR